MNQTNLISIATAAATLVIATYLAKKMNLYPALASVLKHSVHFARAITRRKTKEEIEAMNAATQKKSKFVTSTATGITFCGAQLRAGKLVAFPTETVYGLGGNAFDEEAIKNIFVVKGRPLTDPLIVHVPDIETALKIIDIDGENRKVFEHLAKTFWPGPLTIVAKASKLVPSLVCADTGFVGVRIPSHPVAMKLLKAAKVPVAAPSANRFGHVSPTTANHVYDDLGNAEISILCDDDENENGNSDKMDKIGIESSVLKIHQLEVKRQLVLFRKGGVPQSEIEKALLDGGFKDISIIVPIRPKALQTGAVEDTSKSEQAPGQLLTHYSPDIPSYLIASENIQRFIEKQNKEALSKTIIVDFASQLSTLTSDALAYRDLSPKGNAKEAALNLFDTLRWCEQFKQGERIVLVEVSNLTSNEEVNFADAVYDRMYRAASGKII